MLILAEVYFTLQVKGEIVLLFPELLRESESLCPCLQGTTEPTLNYQTEGPD